MSVELAVVLVVIVFGGVVVASIMGRALSAQAKMLQQALHESNKLTSQFAFQIKTPSSEQVEIETASSESVKEKLPVSRGVPMDEQTGFEIHALD